MPTRNETWDGLRSFPAAGRYFELLSTPAAVDVKIYVADQGGERLVADERSVEAGWFHMRAIGNVLLDPIVRVEVTNPGNQQTKILWSDGLSGNRSVPSDITDDVARILGRVRLAAAHTSATKTAGAASSECLAANASRYFLSVQNQHATDDAYISTDGDAAAANGTSIRIGPGATWSPLVAPTGQVNMIRGGANDITLNVIEA